MGWTIDFTKSNNLDVHDFQDEWNVQPSILDPHCSLTRFTYRVLIQFLKDSWRKAAQPVSSRTCQAVPPPNHPPPSPHPPTPSIPPSITPLTHRIGCFEILMRSFSWVEKYWKINVSFQRIFPLVELKIQDFHFMFYSRCWSHIQDFQDLTRRISRISWQASFSFFGTFETSNCKT